MEYITIRNINILTIKNGISMIERKPSGTVKQAQKLNN